MPLENVAPSANEGGSINIFVQGTADLIDVYSFSLGIETMQQHTLLE